MRSTVRQWIAASELRGCTGLTLLEVIVAFAVLAIASVGLFALTSMSTSGNTRSRDQAAAMALAVEKLEDLENSPFASLASGADDGTLDSGGESGGVYSRSWTVGSRTFTGVSDVPVRDVSVSVSWANGGTVVLTTSIADVPRSAVGFPTAYVQSWHQTQ